MDFVDIHIANKFEKGFFMEYNGIELLFILGFELPEKYIINKDYFTVYLSKMPTILFLSSINNRGTKLFILYK